MTDYRNNDEYYVGEEAPSNSSGPYPEPKAFVCETCDKSVNLVSIRPEMETHCCGCSYEGVYKKEWF